MRSGTLESVEGDPSLTAELISVVEDVLPGVSLDGARRVQGGSHDVVLLPDRAAIRIARTPAAAEDLPRRMALLGQLAQAELPFEVPQPLGPVRTVRGLTACAVSWLWGAPWPKGSGDPAALRDLLGSLAKVDLAPLAGLLDRPHAYAGRERWPELMLNEAVPRLPPRWRAEARRRVEVALELEDVPAGLVHGDLAGDNMHWSSDGRLVGVLDWDLAQSFDAAIDAACLAWHGWKTVRAAVDVRMYQRARIWSDTFGIEQIVAMIVSGAGEHEVERCTVRAARWLQASMEADTAAGNQPDKEKVVI